MWDFLRPYPELKEVIVNTKGGSSFKGALWRRRRSYIVLKNAQLLGENGQKIDGETMIFCAEIEFLQVI